MSSKPIEMHVPSMSAEKHPTISLDETLSATHAGQNENRSLGATGDGVVIGHFLGWNEQGLPQIALPGQSSAVAAASIARLAAEDVGCEVALLFQQGNKYQPVIMGKILEPQAAPPAEQSELSGQFAEAELSDVQAESDGERLVLEAKKEIVLKCGKSSITLTRAGKVLIRGAFVLSRSSGVNRIKGGSVQIN